MNLTPEDQKRIFQTIEKYPGQDYYVYALCDENIPFYIGKGKAERVLQHLKEADNRSVEEAMQMADDESNDIKNPKKNSEKIERIRAAGDNLQHVIIKWGLTEHEAFMCESALINLLKFSKDAVIEKLTNAVDGHASDSEKTSMAGDKTKARTLGEFLNEVAIEVKDISEISENVAFIKINALYEECRNNDPQKELEHVKDSVRAMWKIGSERRKHIRYIFALYKQQVKGIYKVNRVSENIALEWEKNGCLKDFPKFPEDKRLIDEWKARFSSLEQAEKELSSDKFELLKNTLIKECEGNDSIDVLNDHLKAVRQRVYFVVSDVAGNKEIMRFFNCRLEKKGDPNFFTHRKPVRYNFTAKKESGSTANEKKCSRDRTKYNVFYKNEKLNSIPAGKNKILLLIAEKANLLDTREGFFDFLITKLSQKIKKVILPVEEISDKTRFHEREFEYGGVKYRISNQWGIGNLPHLLESMEYEKCLKDFSVIRC